MKQLKQFYKLGGIGGIIGLVGAGIGGLIGLAAAIYAAPVMGTILALIFVGAFGGVYWFVLRPILEGMSDSDTLMTSGESAEATILKLWDTGMTVNQDPQVGLLLEVRPQFGPAFQVATKALIPRLQIPQYQPGTQVEVKYDPKDKTKVAVAAILSGARSYAAPAAVAPVPMQAKQAEEMMLKIDAANRAIAATGESAQATILNRWDMGIMVNGNNPAVALMLEVRPTGRPAFQAEAKGVISAASNAKFLPGGVIWVKYDPNDTTKVTVDHS